MAENNEDGFPQPARPPSNEILRPYPIVLDGSPITIQPITKETLPVSADLGQQGPGGAFVDNTNVYDRNGLMFFVGNTSYGSRSVTTAAAVEALQQHIVVERLVLNRQNGRLEWKQAPQAEGGTVATRDQLTPDRMQTVDETGAGVIIQDAIARVRGPKDILYRYFHLQAKFLPDVIGRHINVGRATVINPLLEQIQEPQIGGERNIGIGTNVDTGAHIEVAFTPLTPK